MITSIRPILVDLLQTVDSINCLVGDRVSDFDYNFEIVAPESLALLKGISEKLLKAKTYERFDSAGIPEIVVKNYDDSIFRLKDISRGILKLSDSIQEPKANIFFSSNNGNNTLFTRNKLFGI